MAAIAPQSALMGFVHRRRRGAELFLLVLALAVGIGAYAAVGIGVEGEVPPGILAYGGWLAGLLIGAHIVVRLVAPYADPVLLPCVAALNGLGLAVIHRLDLAYENIAGKPEDLASKQLTWMTLGVLLFVATLVLLRDHRVLTRFTYTCGALAIVLLLLPMTPGLGTTINGARIWIGVGPFSFQPGEIAKVLLVIAFAGYLVLHRDALALAGRRVLFIDLPRGRDLGPILVMWLISLGILVFQRDLGSSLLFFGALPGDAVRRHRAPRLAGRRRPALLRRRRAGLHAVRPRAEPRQHLARPNAVLRQDTGQRASSSSRCSAWPGAV